MNSKRRELTSACVLIIALGLPAIGCDRDANQSPTAPAAKTLPSADREPAPVAQQQPPSQEAPTQGQPPTQQQPPTQPPGAQGDPTSARAQANPTAPPQAPPGMPSANAEVSDEQLRQFVQVSPKVQAVESRFKQQLEGAQSADEAKKLQAKAREDLDAVFDDADIGVDQFAMIASRLNSDPTFRARLEKVAQ